MDPKKVQNWPFSPTHCFYVSPGICRRFWTEVLTQTPKNAVFHPRSYSKGPNHALEKVLTKETPSSEECVFVESSDRWVSIKMRNSKRVLISAHLPTIKASLEDFNVLLHELEQLIRRFPDHEVILEIDAITKVFSFENGWHVGPCTKPANLTSKEQERASSFTEFLTRTGLVLANTWGRENMIGEATKKPWHKSELLGHIDEERDT